LKQFLHLIQVLELRLFLILASIPHKTE
jgi:hypothetical protein